METTLKYKWSTKDYLAFQNKSSIADKMETRKKHKTWRPTKHVNTHTVYTHTVYTYCIHTHCTHTLYTHTATLEKIMYTERRKLKKDLQSILSGILEIYQELHAIKKKEYSKVLRV